jgi:hypothetical protein
VPLVEKAVASSAGGDTLAAELILRWDAEILGGRAGGDDERIAGVAAVVAGQREGARREIDRMNVIAHDFSAEPLRVRLHALHECGAEEAVCITRPVVDFRGGHELAALLHAGDQKRLAVGACRINGRGIAGRAGSQDYEGAVTRSAHV